MAAHDVESLVEEHYPRILRFALVLTKDAAEAEDLAQETFLQAMRGLSRFDGRSQPATWLHAILLNQHRRRLRTRTRTWRRCLRWFQQTSPAEASPEARLAAAELENSLWREVARLPEPQKQAVLLRYAEDFSYEEIAAVMRCPLGTVKSRLHHGLAALRRALGEEADRRQPCATLEDD